MADLNQVREGLREIDIAVHNLWALGKNMVVGWMADDAGLQVCFAPAYRVLSETTDNPHLLDGSRRMESRVFSRTCRVLQVRPLQLALPFKIGTGPGEVHPDAIDTVIRRYSIVRTGHRAVMLFDIVGFQTAPPIIQLAQFTSLESSISTAGEIMCEAGLDVELARSTAGDGFIYVWNRAAGLEADLRTYLALLMALTDNALGRQQVGFDSPLVPTLRSGFTVGSHFSYHQVEANKPRSFEYATGQVTIALARMLQKALTGQILIGVFQRPVESATGTLDTVLFLARAEALLTRLKGRAVGEHVIKEIRAILSGGTVDKRSHSVVKYAVTDKHGHAHEAFNLRLKVEPEKAALIDLGLAADELAEFDAKPAVYEIPLAGTERPAAQGGAG
ncbi:MAG TPA: hypothetical protein VGB82_13600 [Alphaproteobacteria bacterium]